MPAELTGEIRPGICRPDWSVVTKPAARAALMGRHDARSGLSQKWSRRRLPMEDLVWRTTIELFAGGGNPPSVSEIADAVGLPGEQARAILVELQAHGLLALDSSATAITYAYPFYAGPTEHRVELLGRHLHAVCAVDALGVAAMCRADTTIASSCRTCGDRIEVETDRNGRAVRVSRPAEPVIWYDFAYTQTAVESCCPAIAFFCSDAHLDQWVRVQSPQRVGCQLTLDEGFEVGRALFEPVLATARAL